METLLENFRVILPSDQDASGRTVADEELALLAEAIRSGTLTSTKGRFVKTCRTGICEKTRCRLRSQPAPPAQLHAHGHCCPIDPNPGDEIITSPITDMGALSPILYQGAIPRFADVDARTCNITAESIARCLSDRTKAVIVTHLFGNPCEMGEIMELANAHKIP